MRKKIGIRATFFENIYSLISFFYKIKNFNKLKILIYTDSRGYNVLGKNGRNPFDSYCGKLIKNYNAEYFICEEKHTTILDFLEKIKNINTNKYDAIILHCGIVDFSPRPISNLNWVLNTKKNNVYFNKAMTSYKDYYNNPINVKYNNEKTLNLYSKRFLENIILKELKSLNKLIWISSNKFVENWEGNYKKGRPKNINELVSGFEEILHENLHNVVDLRVWSDEDIKKYTIDNIHFTKEGFLMVYKLIDSKLV